MVKLFAFLKRRAGMTPEEFHTYWREEHGPLVMRTRSGSYVRRYEQNHRLLGTYGAPGGGVEYDGVTVQWFDSHADFEASIREPDYAEIAADLPKFLDVSALVWLLSEEPETFAAPDGGSGTVSP